MSDEIKKNVSDVNIWKRALFMLLFAILYGLAEIIIWAVVIFQFLIVLISGGKNERLLDFGQNLTTYIYQIVMFQTFNTESQPFPFGDWPDGPPEEEEDDDEEDDDDEDAEEDDDEESEAEEEPNPEPAFETIELESDEADIDDEPDDSADAGDDTEEDDKPPA